MFVFNVTSSKIGSQRNGFQPFQELHSRCGDEALFGVLARFTVGFLYSAVLKGVNHLERTFFLLVVLLGEIFREVLK